jgi:hypothetical protein
VPALNKKAGRLIVKNYYEIDKQSIDINFYCEPEMYEGDLGDDSHQWNDIHLSPSNNLCPKCKLFSMDFESMGQFD